jgi:hypothetical protein
VVTSIAPSAAASNANLAYSPPTPSPDAFAGAVATASLPQEKQPVDQENSKSWKIFGWSWTTSKADRADLEKGADMPSSRPIRLLAPIYAGLGAGLAICECYIFIDEQN